MVSQELLVLAASLEITQSDLERSSGNLCPANLRILCEHGSRLGILDVEIKNFNGAVVDLYVSHGAPPSMKSRAVNHRLAVALTEPGVHVSMISFDFSNASEVTMPARLEKSRKFS